MIKCIVSRQHCFGAGMEFFSYILLHELYVFKSIGTYLSSGVILRLLVVLGCHWHNWLINVTVFLKNVIGSDANIVQLPIFDSGFKLHKKWSFPIRISSESVTKLRIWSHLLKKSLNGKFHILCSITKKSA